LLVVLAIGSLASSWLLLGFTTGIILAMVALLGVVFSRDLKRGITTTINETLFEDLGDKKEEFMGSLEKELTRRGMVPRIPLEKGIDLIYRDFFTEVRIYASPEDAHLRFSYRISATTSAIALGILFLVPFVVGSFVVFALAILRHNNTYRTIQEASQTAALLAKDVKHPSSSP
jgi:hypothetical protein